MKVLRVSHSAVVDAWRERERELRSLGVEVALLTARSWPEAGSVVRAEARDGEDLRSARTWGDHPALFVYDPVAVWRAVRGSWDLVDVHEEPYSLAATEVLALAWLSRLLHRRPRPRLRYTLYSAQNLRKKHPVPFRWIERILLRHASGLSVCNAEAGEIARERGLVPAPDLIPLGIDPDAMSPGSSPREADDGVVRVGFAGRLEERKGLRVLLDAVAGDNRLELHVAGDGPLRAELLQAPRTTWHGSLAGAALTRFYRDLDVLAVPSLTTPTWVEQFGRVVVEAMACGTPVVVSSSGALPELFGDAALVVPEGDSEALRSALLRAATDRAGALRDAGLACARRCTWTEVARQYLHMYERAVGPGSAGSPVPTAGRRPRPVEVIVVAYHHPEMLARALSPVAGTLPTTVVDNSSSPAVRHVADDAGVIYLDPGANTGFARAVNLALANRLAPDADVLLLNPDAEVDLRSVEAMGLALEADPRLASVGPRQVDDDGVPARVSWPWPSPGRALAEALGLGRLCDRDDFVIGSVLLLRAEAIRDVGGLDEQFFLYAEETDWARRASDRGWRHAIVPNASAVHAGGGTSDHEGRRITHFYASQEKYFRKHFGALGWQVARSAQVAGAAARGLLLTGQRGAAARARARILVSGPHRTERRLLGGRWP
ncbi:glycosyltransferase [Luteimicrobium subarcticum]|uniref:D-inositol 3-phosphate glycosyltransferase n=1 Tax=Luteimicrobium subarcticum TaxID=620910 RepID=A0A2M8WT88_9MICO|nr:glycosyltransferase [Luteimicrobium subarcticum]PJI94108.1 glycosyltransferase involved in cell wall biosynthesis [Luteimicrobium subarcticum]